MANQHRSPAQDWLEAELADTLDEDFELELEDAQLSLEISRIYKGKHPDTIDRHSYFTSLLRLQSELIKLQDWVQYHQKKVVVLFEGRDSAGKGGVIKRITQRLNPRVVRVVALPAPSDREKTQAASVGNGTPRPRKRCWRARTYPRRLGTSLRATTKSGQG